MSAILGTHQFDLWSGPPPPQIKSKVELIFRPGQASASAKILPEQSDVSTFEGVLFVPSSISHTYADSYRGVIGQTLPLVWGSNSWGPVFVIDVTLVAIEKLLFATGRHPSGTAYSYSPAARITSRWTIARLSK